MRAIGVRGNSSLLAVALIALVPCAARAQEAQPPAHVQASSASEALQFLLDNNIKPGGPLRGDGATIAGVLAGQSLTFPIASSSGAYVTRNLEGFGPPNLAIATSGSFGPLFAERGFTNGRHNLSVSFTYQHKTWGSLSDVGLRDYNLRLRAVFRNEHEGEPAGTTEDFTADVRYKTDVYVIAANYGIFSFLDAGISVPYVSASVHGTKQRVRTEALTQTVSTISRQDVSGDSSGIGDVILRLKARVPFGDHKNVEPARFGYGGIQTAVGFDLRMPTGATATLKLDQGKTQEVPNLGLGVTTEKLAVLSSVVLGPFSPHVNLGYVWVPSFACDRKFNSSGRCKGSIFELDGVNGTQDAKNQHLSDEWNGTAGVDYQVVPYRATLSFDIIARQLVHAGQFYQGPARLIYRDENGDKNYKPDPSVSTEMESRHGNVNTLLGALGVKVGFARQWVLVGDVLFPLNRQGLQPDVTWVIGLERSLAH